MRYELDGHTYFTETKRITRTLIHETTDNGQVMTCLFGGLPYDATENQIHEYMVAKGAKVVE